MYLWKVDALVEDFKLEKVSQKEEFKYMLIFTILMSFAGDPLFQINSSYNLYDSILSIAVLCISILGTYFCFKINTSGDNKNFIARIICIGLPSMIRVSVFFIPIVIIASFIEVFFIYPEIIEEENTETTILEILVISLFIATYYWYLSTKISSVSKA